MRVSRPKKYLAKKTTTSGTTAAHPTQNPAYGADYNKNLHKNVMSAELIRARSALPKEFDQKKYRDLHKLNVEQWSALATVRFHLYRRLREYIAKNNDLTMIRGEITELLKAPMGKLLLNFNGSSGVDEGDDPYCVCSMNMFSLLSIAGNRQRYGTAIDAYAAYALGSDLSDEQRAILHTPVFLAGSPPSAEMRPFRIEAEIDLWAPDEILVRDFRRWLEGIRKITAPKSLSSGRGSHVAAQTVGNLRTIVQAQAIPYLDLKLWSMAFGKRITAPVYADALGITDDRSVNETTKKWAKWLILPRTVETLQGQAAADACDAPSI